jgi:hypothetical protein
MLGSRSFPQQSQSSVQSCPNPTQLEDELPIDMIDSNMMKNKTFLKIEPTIVTFEMLN